MPNNQKITFAPKKKGAFASKRTFVFVCLIFLSISIAMLYAMLSFYSSTQRLVFVNRQQPSLIITPLFKQIKPHHLYTFITKAVTLTPQNHAYSLTNPALYQTTQPIYLEQQLKQAAYNSNPFVSTPARINLGFQSVEEKNFENVAIWWDFWSQNDIEAMSTLLQMYNNPFYAPTYSPSKTEEETNRLQILLMQYFAEQTMPDKDAETAVNQILNMWYLYTLCYNNESVRLFMQKIIAPQVWNKTYLLAQKKPYAMASVAYMLYNGIGVTQNPNFGHEWEQAFLAALATDQPLSMEEQAQAQIFLALQHCLPQDTPNYPMALYWMEQAAKTGSFTGIYTFALFSTHVEQIRQQAPNTTTLQYFQQAATLAVGSLLEPLATSDYAAYAHNLYAHQLSNGVEETQTTLNSGAVTALLLKAATIDPQQGMYNLATAQYLGNGALPKNKTAALANYTQSAKALFLPAPHMIGVMHYNGEATKKDKPFAYGCFEHAYASGIAESGFYLAHMLYYNESTLQGKSMQAFFKDTPTPTAQAVRILERMGKEYPQTGIPIAMLYLTAKGVAYSPAKAIVWLKHAYEDALFTQRQEHFAHADMLIKTLLEQESLNPHMTLIPANYALGMIVRTPRLSSLTFSVPHRMLSFARKDANTTINYLPQMQHSSASLTEVLSILAKKIYISQIQVNPPEIQNFYRLCQRLLKPAELKTFFQTQLLLDAKQAKHNPASVAYEHALLQTMLLLEASQNFITHYPSYTFSNISTQDSATQLISAYMALASLYSSGSDAVPINTDKAYDYTQKAIHITQ